MNKNAFPKIIRDPDLKRVIKSITVDRRFIYDLLLKNNIDEKLISQTTIYLSAEKVTQGIEIIEGTYSIKNKSITCYIGTQINSYKNWFNAIKDTDSIKKQKDVHEWVLSKFISGTLIHELKHYIEDATNHSKYSSEIKKFLDKAAKASVDLRSTDTWKKMPWEIRAEKFSDREIAKAEKNEHFPITIKLKT